MCEFGENREYRLKEPLAPTILRLRLRIGRPADKSPAPRFPQAPHMVQSRSAAMKKNQILSGPWIDRSEAIAWVVTHDAVVSIALRGKSLAALHIALAMWAVNRSLATDGVLEASAAILDALRSEKINARGVPGEDRGAYQPSQPIPAHDWSRLQLYGGRTGFEVYKQVCLDDPSGLWTGDIAFHDVRISAVDLLAAFPAPTDAMPAKSISDTVCSSQYEPMERTTWQTKDGLELIAAAFPDGVIPSVKQMGNKALYQHVASFAPKDAGRMPSPETIERLTGRRPKVNKSGAKRQ